MIAAGMHRRRCGRRWAAVAIAAVLCSKAPHLQASETGGWLSLEYRRYTDAQPGFLRSTLVASGQVEAETAVGDNGRLVLKAYGRNIRDDNAGNIADLPMAKYSYGQEGWRVEFGFDTVFWGVAESQRVVNVVNQVDLRRSLRGDTTLGQPMLAASWLGDSFRLDTLLLPWFRERPYGGHGFRAGLELPIDDRRPLYESEDRQRHVDFAARGSGRVGAVEGGLSVFSGTLREPTFVLDTDQQVLRPWYRQGRQIGLDLQWTQGATLLKLEAKDVALRQGTRSRTAVYGIEHAFGRVAGSTELTVFVEHNWDSRGEDAPTWLQNDLFLGMRVDLANTLATTFTLGVYQDLDFGSRVTRALVETRLNDQLNLALEAYVFSAHRQQDQLYYASRLLDQVALKLVWHF